MFLLRLLRKLLFLALFAFLGFWAATYEIQGVPLYKKVGRFFSSDGFKQGVKDLRLFFGGLLKSLGEEIEDVSEEDQKALDSMIQKKLKESGNGEQK